MENKDNSKIKLKKCFKVPLIIIGVILLLLMLLGIFVYINDGNTKDIYNKVINEFTSELNFLVEKNNNANKVNGNIGLDCKSQVALSSDEQAIFDLFNNLKIEYGIEIDTELEKANIDLKAKYEEDDLVDININNINDETFIGLGNLYDKKIKLNKENIWISYLTQKDKKDLILELSKILKNSLKEEYFSKEKEIIKISDKKIYTTKHTLELNAKDLYDVKISIIDEIKTSKVILEKMALNYNLSQSELINKLNSYRNELKVEEKEYLKIDLYLNLITKDLEKLVIGNAEDKIIFTKVKKYEYDISYSDNNLSNLVGNLNVKDNKVKLTYDKDIKINLEYDKKNINLNISDEEYKMNVNLTYNDDKMNYIIEFIVLDSDIEIKITIDGKIESIEKVSDKIITDFIKFEDMTDEDIAIIYSKLLENETLLTLITDISYIYSSLLEYEEESLPENNFSGMNEIPMF